MEVGWVGSKGGWSGDGQGGSEQRIEIFVKIQKTNRGRAGQVRGGEWSGLRGGGVRVDVIENVKLL